MASLVGTTVAANFEQINKGFNGLGPRTRIIKIVDSGDAITESDMVGIIKNLTLPGGVDGALTNDSDAFTVAGIDGVPGTDQTIHVALQGDGTLDLTDAANSVANTTVTLEADFNQTTGV